MMNSILAALTPARKGSSKSASRPLDSNAVALAQDSPRSARKTPSSSSRITPLRSALRKGADTPDLDGDDGGAQESPRPKARTPLSIQAKHRIPLNPVENDANTTTAKSVDDNHDSPQEAAQVTDKSPTPQPPSPPEPADAAADDDDDASPSPPFINYDELEMDGDDEENEQGNEEERRDENKEEGGDEEYTFKRFLDFRWAENSIEIEVEWDSGETTWEPEVNLHHDAPDSLFAYWREQGGRPENPYDPEMYEVFAIRKHTRNRQRLLVEWVGYEPKERTWLSRKVLEETAEDVLTEYWESLK